MQEASVPESSEGPAPEAGDAPPAENDHELVNKAAHEIDWSDLQGGGNGRGVRWGDEAVEDVRRQIGWDSRQTA